MTDRPIPFSAPMIRATLEDRKSQTRRVIVPQPPADAAFALITHDHTGSKARQWGWMTGDPEHVESIVGLDLFDVCYAIGDRLWCREAWRTAAVYDDLSQSQLGGEEPLKYEVDGAVDLHGGRMDGRWGRYRLARFMPRWASRLTLIVTDVRVQRLQDISEEDAWDEGIQPQPSGLYRAGYEEDTEHDTAVEAYADLWDHVHGEGAWGQNPWVEAYTFTVHRCNIDQMEQAR